jgi:beta-lactamase class A
VDGLARAVKAGAARSVSDPALDALLAGAAEQAARDHPGVVRSISAYLYDLRSGRHGRARAEADIYPASIVKVPIMAEVFRRYAEGTLRPDQRVVVSADNQTATSGPAPLHPGYEATVDELVSLMIAHSDNVATNQLIDVLRRERVTSYMHDLGLHTFSLGRKLSGSEPLIDDPEQIGRNRLPALEIGTLLAQIATDAIDGAREQRRILQSCVDGGKLAAGLLEHDTFMHKTGETSQVSHDAGILQTRDGRRHVVALYCEVIPTPDRVDADFANPFMARWMRVVREAL